MVVEAVAFLLWFCHLESLYMLSKVCKLRTALSLTSTLVSATLYSLT